MVMGGRSGSTQDPGAKGERVGSLGLHCVKRRTVVEELL